MTTTTYGLLLRSLRIRTGLTQAEMGAAIGVSTVSIGAWERGSVVPRADDLADYLHVCVGTDAERLAVLDAIRLARL